MTRDERLALQRAYAAKWRRRNRKHIRKYHRLYYRKHMNALRAYKREQARKRRANGSHLTETAKAT